MTSAHDTDTDEDFMSPVEVQAALGVSRRTLWRYRERGILAPSHHTPTGHARFRRVDVEAVRERSAPTEAGRVDVETVLAVLAVVVAFTLGLNFVGPHYVTAVLVLALSIGALCFYLGVLVTVPRAMPQPRRAGRGRRDRVADVEAREAAIAHRRILGGAR